MKADTLAAIRAEAVTEQDALDCVNALICNFKPTSIAGDALLDAALVIDDQLHNTTNPTLDDIAIYADFARRSRNEDLMMAGSAA